MHPLPQRPILPLRQRIDQIGVRQLAVCSVVKAELFFGAMKSMNPRQTLALQQQFLASFVSLPFDDPAALVYGRIRAQLEQAGTPIGANDLLIAAIALAHGVTLVTHNIAEFQRVAGLQVDDWEIP